MQTSTNKYLISSDVSFQDRLDEADPFTAPLEDLQRLIDDAPGLYEAGFLAGVFALRQQLLAITGRSH